MKKFEKWDTHKKNIIITSILILLPILAGLLFWNKLPEQLPTHFAANGKPDKYSPKALTVFGLPILVLVIHLFCVVFTFLDPRHKNLSPKVFKLILYICPAVSLLCSFCIYGSALHNGVNTTLATFLFLGLLFIAIGNYLPKCQQNNTIGIRIPWTLNNADNWYHTHRLAGWIWVFGGFITVFCSLLEVKYLYIILTGVFALMVLIPICYSGVLYYKKK